MFPVLTGYTNTISTNICFGLAIGNFSKFKICQIWQAAKWLVWLLCAGSHLGCKTIQVVELSRINTYTSSGSRIWLRGGPKFLLAYIADVTKLSRMSEASTSWPGVQGPALGPQKLTGFSLPNMHSPCFLSTFLWYFDIENQYKISSVYLKKFFFYFSKKKKNNNKFSPFSFFFFF